MLHFYYGTMNSGKSTRLLQEAFNMRNRGFSVVIAQSALNVRDNGVESRIGLSSKSDIVYDETTVFSSILENEEVDELLVDEAQFLTKKQVEELFIISLSLEIPVLCYGLKNDFKGKSFPGSNRLLELAELEQLDTVPCNCGKKARFNGRFNTKTGALLTAGPEVFIEGSLETYRYDPICGSCFLKLGGKL